MADAPQESELAALLSILRNACTELHEVRGELKKVGEMDGRLAAVESCQRRMESKMDEAAKSFQQTQVEYIQQTSRHALEIQALTLKTANYDLEIQALTLKTANYALEIQALTLKTANYDTLVSTINDLEKKLFAYILMAAVSAGIIGALFAGVPPWLDQISPQKADQATALLEPKP